MSHGSGDMHGRSKQRTTPSEKFQLQNRDQMIWSGTKYIFTYQIGICWALPHVLTNHGIVFEPEGNCGYGSSSSSNSHDRKNIVSKLLPL
ncbi:hypothetical protein Bca52824_072812 [Brassica carinata]|uniref:Uncharacterized protein n=1 Tax=Brassica carinata TaxID=52824 RepID=A0A8X7Q9F8_BRACI|nr:hypothetical protein Bca52824_072812 [Brassica carinata]